MAEQIKRGDRFVWNTDPGVFIEVRRVARDGSWADIRCYTWARAWSKRQALPLPDDCERRSWTADDVFASGSHR